MPDDPPISRDDFRRVVPIVLREGIAPPDRLWSDENWAAIHRGHKSSDMDDKWNAFVEGQRLYLLRSWTGRVIYEAEFRRVPGGWQIGSAVVEGSRDSYRRQDDAYESALLEAVIDGRLLGVWDGPSHQRWVRAAESLESPNAA